MSRQSRWSSDLVGVVLLVVLADAAVLLGAPWPLRWALGLPLLVVLPGYALVSAVVPSAPGPSDAGARRIGNPGWSVRVAASLATSVLVVAFVAVLCEVVWGIRLVPVVLGVSIVTVVGTEVAAIRRMRCPPHSRAAPLARLPGTLRAAGARPGRTAVTLLAAVVLVGALTMAGAAPSGGTPYTEAFLLTDDGEPVADEFPRDLTAGEPTTIDLAVENHEGEPTDYGVVVLLERVENGSVAERERLDAFELRLSPDERAVVEREVTPAMTGERLRLRVLVYEGGVPAGPAASPDLRLRVWVGVAPAGG